MITKGNNDHLVDLGKLIDHLILIFQKLSPFNLLVPHQLDFLGPQELSQYFVRGFQQCNSVQRYNSHRYRLI